MIMMSQPLVGVPEDMLPSPPPESGIDWDAWMLDPEYRTAVLDEYMSPAAIDYTGAIKVEMDLLGKLDAHCKAASYGFTSHEVYQIWVTLVREYQDAHVVRLLDHVATCHEDGAEAEPAAVLAGGVGSQP